MRLRAASRTAVAYGLLVAALSVVGCGSHDPTAPSTPTPIPTPVPAPTPTPNAAYPYDGYWVGTTSEGRFVNFVIRYSYVAQSEVDYNVAGTCGWGINSVAGVPIEGGAFKFSYQSNYLVTPLPVTGTFSSTTSLTGTIGPMIVAAGVCGTTSQTPRAVITYTATKQ